MKSHSPVFAVAAMVMSALRQNSKSPRYNITALGTSGMGIFRICYGLSRVTELCGGVILSLAMRLRVWFLTLVFLAFPTLPAFAGTAEQAQLLQAQQLSNQGELAQVVRVLEPLVHSRPDALDDASRGMAWNLLGSAHEDLGDYEQARQCYETAIHLLRTLSAAVSTYASALANLGFLEMSTDPLNAAATLHKAKGFYAKAGDHAGLAEVATDLATLAIARNDTHAARGFVADAFREAEQVKDLGDSDRAAMYSVRGSLSARSHDFTAAVRDYQQSIDCWIRARGPAYYLVALDYTLQADAYRELGDYSKAKSDIAAALVLVEQTVGRNSPLYAAAELTDARLLRATGANAEASQKETVAKAALDGIRRRQCNGCSISAASLR
jgi:tetratricopeptide (TPR) repeat protein